MSLDLEERRRARRHLSMPRASALPPTPDFFIARALVFAIAMLGLGSVVFLATTPGPGAPAGEPPPVSSTGRVLPSPQAAPN